MSSSPMIAALPRAPSINPVPLLEPYLVEVIIPFSTGTVDEAVRQATIVAQSLVTAAINNILGAAPTVLDTIAEIDAAISNDPNFATTMATALASKALKITKVQGGGLATGGGDLSADRTITVTVASNAQAQQGQDNVTVITPANLWVALKYLLQQPNVLISLLPTTQPTQAGVPWVNGGVISIT